MQIDGARAPLETAKPPKRALKTLYFYYVLHASLLFVLPLLNIFLTQPPDILWQIDFGAYLLAFPILSIATHLMNDAHLENWIGTHYVWLYRTMWISAAIYLLLLAWNLFSFPGTAIDASEMTSCFLVWPGYRYIRGWAHMRRARAMYPSVDSGVEIYDQSAN